jgi:hypothetical protein
MAHFKIIGWFWLLFGAVGLVYTGWQFATSLDLIFIPGGFSALFPIVFGMLFTFFSALAGLGLLKCWRWARIATEVLGGILLTFSIILNFDGEVISFYVLLACFACYSLVVTLYFKYDTDKQARYSGPGDDSQVGNSGSAAPGR